jgi:predicted alpha/beta-fold hydrolase
MPKLRSYICLGTLTCLLVQKMTTGFSQTPLTANTPTIRSSTESLPQQPSVATQTYRDTSHLIATNFSSTEFKPHPAFTNCHIQTICGVYLRSLEDYKYVSHASNIGLLQTAVKSALSLLFLSDSNPLINPDRDGFYDERQRFETLDGDFFDVDFKYHHGKQAASNKGMVIILHGLQSNSRSSLSVDMATAYLNRGFDVACINFRGCSGETNRKLGGYHLGFTDDLKQFLGHLKTKGKLVSQARQHRVHCF